MTTAKEIIDAAGEGMFLDSPYRNQVLDWKDAATPRKRYKKQARAALLAALRKFERDLTEGIANATIASLGSDDDRPSAEIAFDVWAAGCRALRKEIEQETP